MLSETPIDQRLAEINWEDVNDIRRRAKSDIEVFKFIFTRIEEQNDADRDARARSIQDPQTAKVFADLVRDGVAVWPGMFSDPAFLESARKFVKDSAKIAKALFTLHPDKKDVEHNGLLYSTSEPLNKQIAPVETMPIYGRTRTMWNTAASGLGHETGNLVGRDPRINTILTAYSGRPPAELFVIAEELLPSYYGQEWHLDKWYEQIKAIILLTDCTILNGPLRLVKGTHRNRSDRIWKMMHDHYALGASYSCTSDYAVSEDGDEIFWGTGKAGDVVFLDATALHAGTQCHEGERMNFVFYPIAASLKSHTLLSVLGE